MDAKALAKSKRAHSLHHHKKHNQNPTFKAPIGSSAANNRKKPSVVNDKQKAPQSHGSRALPSNWERYEEEYDSGPAGVPHASTSQASDVVVPKSKGADYTHVMSEAKAQSQSSCSMESFTLFNDILDEFNQGFASLLSTRGQHLVSWSSDDNFLLDDKESSSHEAPFLSLNLHCLAGHLEKTNLAERLFIEPDLFPQELCTEVHANVVGNPDKDQAATGGEATEGVLDRLDSSIIPEKNQRINKSHGYVPSNSLKSSNTLVPTCSSEDVLDHPVDSHWQLDEAGHSSSTSDLTANPFDESPSRFDAGAAEAELDFLLDSLSGTKNFDSSVREQLSSTSSTAQGSLVQSTNSGMVASDLDVDIDDLLNETSGVLNMKRISLSYEPKTMSDTSSASFLPSNSKALDDFDSWLDTI